MARVTVQPFPFSTRRAAFIDFFYSPAAAVVSLRSSSDPFFVGRKGAVIDS